MTTTALQTTLQQQVETMSNGQMTVRYTASGQPSYFYRLKAFNVQDLDPSLGTGLHPAFTVNGVAKSEILIGVHQAAKVNNEMVSQPGLTPLVSINHDDAVALARNAGSGWTLCTNAMYAALALSARASGKFPRGNNNYGLAYNASDEYGVDGSGNSTSVGGTSGSGVTAIRSGSGPIAWNYPANPFGVQNLNGNVWEWAPGMRVNNGEINVIADNDATLSTTDMSAASAAWKAIDATSGALVAPGSAGTVHYATSGTTAGTLVLNSGGQFKNMVANGVATAALQTLMQLGLMPPGAPIETDAFYLNTSGEFLPVRGGGWGDGASAGVFALYLNRARSYANPSFGCRPAFVI